VLDLAKHARTVGLMNILKTDLEDLDLVLVGVLYPY